ncbi:hypothetical protein TUBRATIS_001620 [Tubulinosema ratisbonensis]|uniref:Uncharacterized protein n=1 Tax=Tubulinosema ratisbonensis TaxID=291195 RepID=A0A437AQR1_9MICR|nr:hypothetical protein TUBRATIS_001620 [Tubulinosema ratisbonensis]
MFFWLIISNCGVVPDKNTFDRHIQSQEYDSSTSNETSTFLSPSNHARNNSERVMVLKHRIQFQKLIAKILSLNISIHLLRQQEINQTAHFIHQESFITTKEDLINTIHQFLNLETYMLNNGLNIRCQLRFYKLAFKTLSHKFKNLDKFFSGAEYQR